MQWVDGALLAVLGISVLLGAWRGLVFELLSVLSWIVAFVLAQWFAHDTAARMPLAGASEPIRHAAGFVLVFVMAVLAGGLVAALLKRFVGAIGLRPADRMLGALFGAVRGVLLLLVLAIAMAMTPLGSASDWRESQGARGLDVLIRGLKPALPSEVAQYLP